ncbi:MAG TPA: hypothetical protein VMV29_03610 [Ktedonobacterales bacterium]|nr:hypothetical protein [Ktedonobacterales bacterium]
MQTRPDAFDGLDSVREFYAQQATREQAALDQMRAEYLAEATSLTVDRDAFGVAIYSLDRGAYRMTGADGKRYWLDDGEYADVVARLQTPGYGSLTRDEAAVAAFADWDTSMASIEAD